MAFPDNFNLARFTTAQDRDYERALNEMKHGQKRTHWMWYIFPVPPGISLSGSARSQLYAITSLDEAKAYLGQPVLRARLVEISQAVLDCETPTALKLMGELDLPKLQACMTLFLRVDPEQEVFAWQKVLDKYYESETHDKVDEFLEVKDESRSLRTEVRRRIEVA